MAGASVAIAPSGILNPRNQSISGRREDAQDWSISGITRASIGFAVTISSDGDNSLMGSVTNGVNNPSLDLPGYTPGSLNLNSNRQNARSYFNRSRFSPDALGTAGTASRRSFHGPGMVKIAEAEALGSARILDTFNHAQVLGSVPVDGDIGSKLLARWSKPLRRGPYKVALKFTF